MPLRACFGARLLLQSYWYPNLSEGADRVTGKCPFSGATKSGRVWRKVLESDARSVGHTPSIAFRHLHPSRKNVVNRCLELESRAHSEHRFRAP